MSDGKGISENIIGRTVEEIEDSQEKEDLKKLEAIFFISGRFLTMQELISFSDLNPIMLRDLIEKLKEKYNTDDSAIEIVYKNNAWKMDVRQEYFKIVNRMATGSSEFSKSEKETLAIIAYKQPIKQSVLIKIRSNKAYDHIKKFNDLGLIKRKKIGHTYEISLSDEFYEYFNLEDSDRNKNPLKESVEVKDD
ncbi:MAG: SMC-Scp complex subunit ScpB [Candidatus Pacearchaeota archaeon]